MVVSLNGALHISSCLYACNNLWPGLINHCSEQVYACMSYLTFPILRFKLFIALHENNQDKKKKN